MKVSRMIAILSPLVVAAGCDTYDTTHPHATTTSSGDVISYPPYRSTTSSTSSSTISYGSDSLLANSVRNALNQAPAARNLSPPIQVNVDNGTVTLNGSVPNYQVRESVISVVRNTPGVRGVRDELLVANTAQTAPVYTPPPQGAPGPGAAAGSSTLPEGNSPSVLTGSSAVSGQIFSMQVDSLTEADRSLAQRILQGLRTDAALEQMLPRVLINVSEGRVVLQGTVQSQAQRQAVADAVRRAAGVGNLEDDLQVRF
jgi:osmotically-inducible protein OsmY